MTQQAAANTDRELYREPDKGNGSFYSDSIHVTAGGGIGINVGGTVIVRSLKTWHKLALAGKNMTMDYGEANKLHEKADRIAFRIAAGGAICIVLIVAAVYFLWF